MGQTVKIPIFQKFQFLTTPRSKNPSYGAKSRWANLGANGDPNGAKRWVKTVKILIFQMFKFSKRFMEPNHGGDSLGPIVGPMGPHWDQKMGQNRKNSNFPKIPIFYYAAVKRSILRRQITVATHRAHLGANGGPIGAKRWVKTVKIPIFQNLEFLTTLRSKNPSYSTKSRWGPIKR